MVGEGRCSLDRLKGVLRLRERQPELSVASKGQKASSLHKTQFFLPRPTFPCTYRVVKRPISEILAVPQCSIEGWTESIRGDVIPGRPPRLCGRGCSPPAELVGHLVLLVVRPSCEPEPNGGCNKLGKHRQPSRRQAWESVSIISMSSTVIGEPFQLYLGSTSAQKILTFEAVYTTHNRDFSSYATVTAQADGIHIWDVSTKLFIAALRSCLMRVQLQNLHAVASYSVGKHVTFAIPAFSLYVTEDGNRSVISYTVVRHFPGASKEHRGRTIWVIRQSISGSVVTASEKTAVLVRSSYPRDAMTFFRHHPRLMSHPFEYVVQVMTRYRCYSFQKMQVSFLPTRRRI